MIRTITRPSTAGCTLPMYIGFLLSEPNGASCRRMASVLSISHDNANRFLNRESYEPKDLYREVEPTINIEGGLFNRLLKTYASQFNWAYRDGYPEVEIIQTGWLFSLYCLSLFGNKWRPCSFYADKFLNAFPMALDGFDDTPYSSDVEQFHSCYRVRTMERFAHFWGLIETEGLRNPVFLKAGQASEIKNSIYHIILFCYDSFHSGTESLVTSAGRGAKVRHIDKYIIYHCAMAKKRQKRKSWLHDWKLKCFSIE